MSGSVRWTCGKCHIHGDAGPKTENCPHCGKRLTLYVYRHYKNRVIRLRRDERGFKFANYHHAHAILSQINVDIYYGRFDSSRYIRSEQRKYRFDKVIEAYIRDEELRVEQGQLAAGTLYQRQCHIRNHLLSLIASDDIRDIRPLHVREWSKELFRKGLGPEMVRKVLRTLKHILAWALQSELIQSIPVFPQIKTPETKHTWIDEETQDRVFAEIPESDKGIFLFLRHQGCRIGEAVALHWEDIDFERQTATIRRSMAEYPRLLRTTKTGKENIVPLHPEVLKWLRANRAPRQFVFLGQKGKPYQFSHLRRVWHRACEKAGLPGVTLNQGVRHSFGSRKVSEGHDIYAVGQLMGHKSVETTKRYARHDLESKRRVITGVVEMKHGKQNRVDR